MASERDPFGQIPDLQSALAQFTAGAQQYGIAQSLMDANQKIQSVKSSALKESEKSAAITNISNAMAMEMTARGASPGSVQSVYQTIKPAMPATADQAILQGIMKGDQEMLGQGRRASQIQLEDNLKLEDTKTQRAMQLELMKEHAKNKVGQKTEDIAFATNVNAAQRNLNDLEKLVRGVGNTESINPLSFFSDKEKGAQLKQLMYDTAIAYAKVVDPTSVAREGEVAAAQKYTIPAGALVSNKATIAAIKNLRKNLDARKKDRATITGAATQSNPSGVNAVDLNKYLVD